MNEKDFLGHWKLLKPLILSKWPKLKESDLEGTQPVVRDLVKVIRKKYQDMPEQSIVEDLENLGQQILKNP